MTLSLKYQEERHTIHASPTKKVRFNKVHESMEQQLIKNAQNGDRAAFQQLLSQNLPNILGLSFRMLNDKAQAEDLAQDVMLKLWQNLKDYDNSRGKLSTWVYRITANRCLDQLRKKTPDQLDENYDAPGTENQHQDLLNKQISGEVDDVLNELPDRQRLALILFHYQGHSLTEIGQIMECSAEAVESLLARARRTLKTTLKPVWSQMQEHEI